MRQKWIMVPEKQNMENEEKEMWPTMKNMGGCNSMSGKSTILFSTDSSCSPKARNTFNVQIEGG